MRNACVVFLSFAVSALAYQVTAPSASKGWTDTGAQTLTWQRVDTDRLNFTVVLTNEDRSVMPINDQVLAAQVDGTLLTTVLNPPSAGWPVGQHFRVNLVKSPEELDTILAQSNEFDILPPKEETTSKTGTTLRPSTTPTTPATQTTVPSGNGNTGGDSADGSTNPPGINSASVPTIAHSGILSVFALLGFFLA
ncbi:hypothetical protein BDZ94DRAFT_1256266 [Collybia nuda]|uniref:Yeast cell wall synthesis Kre9/Knh1-like N-terminal domain-containing protein n=1 Tax=Collybia nuda TaxID=64659 RepID=A0A9P6CFP5_9AGAR|nr:hypothetical protein BDZ94DRAFT_1256266 [Collybia nuda]